MDDLLSVEGGRDEGGDGTLCMLLCCEVGRLKGDERRDTSRDVFLLLSFNRLLVGLRERRPRGDLKEVNKI